MQRNVHLFSPLLSAHPQWTDVNFIGRHCAPRTSAQRTDTRGWPIWIRRLLQKFTHQQIQYCQCHILHDPYDSVMLPCCQKSATCRQNASSSAVLVAWEKQGVHLDFLACQLFAFGLRWHWRLESADVSFFLLFKRHAHLSLNLQIKSYCLFCLSPSNTTDLRVCLKTNRNVSLQWLFYLSVTFSWLETLFHFPILKNVEPNDNHSTVLLITLHNWSACRNV